MTGTSTTVVVVAYGVTTLAVDWVPESHRIIVVHNDERLDPASVRHPCVEHVHPGRNLGFGAAVNHVMLSVDTDRLLLVNPDAEVTREHWHVLTAVGPHELATVPLNGDRGQPTVVVSAYPTAVAHLLAGYRVGRLAGRDTRRRRLAARTLGRFGRAHDTALAAGVGTWPLAERWLSGAVLSIPMDLFRAIGGFDPSYFLYYEDVDFCARLAAFAPETRGTVADVPAGHHRVGGSAEPIRSLASPSERHRLDSAITYAERHAGIRWRAVEHALRLRRRLGARHR